MAKNDLLGCVCLTYKNIDLFEKSVEQFEKQTYKNKVLIVVDNSSVQLRNYSQMVDDILSNHKTIKSFHIKEKSGKTTGFYRQVGLVKAFELGCRYFATWDDDDIFSNNRLEYQVNALKKDKNAQMCMLNNFNIELRRKIGGTISFDCHTQGGVCGSMVVDLKNELKKVYEKRISFENRKIAEDVRYIEDFTDTYGKDSLLLLENPYDYYIYVEHGNNTTSYKHFINMIKECGVQNG